jgi:hypothetical protein
MTAPGSSATKEVEGIRLKSTFQRQDCDCSNPALLPTNS